MKLLERVHGGNGVRIIVGSAFFWAWLDALFMSMLFVTPQSEGLMAEMGAVAVFGLSIPGFVVALRKPAAFNRMLAQRRFPLAFGALGTVGSLLFLLAGLQANWALLAAGGICGGAFMSLFQMAWGATYCHDGARSATPYVAGAFACAVVIDVPLLFMIPEAAAVFFSLLPLATSALFVTIAPEQRTYRRRPDAAANPTRKGLAAHLKTHLGTSMTLLLAVMLIAVSFGYLQHLVSFSSIAGDGPAGGILVQIVRGIAAVAMFAIIVVASWRASAVYRVGLLAMVAGFMMMPFLFGTDLFWISGAVIISGYTAFDLLIWVAFSQIAHNQSRDPFKTIAVIRLLSVICYVVGALVGIALVGNDEMLHEFVSAETTVVGYLVVIATVLMLSSEDMWMLFGGRRPLPGELSADAAADQEARMDAWFDEIGLTAREREIAALLALGRTQPWIAERLNISENTVGTHVRHIYQKADVHDRQQFIDIVSTPGQTASPDSRDERSASCGSPDISK